MDLYNLKISKDLPYHYIISVVMHPITSGKLAGQIHLKYGPLYFHNDDVTRLRDALILSQDKLFPTSRDESLKIHEVEELVYALGAMSMACAVNLGTMHHFSSASKMEDDDFLNIVDLANKNGQGRKLLDDSKIKTPGSSPI